MAAPISGRLLYWKGVSCMVFSSVQFLFIFLPLVLLCYYLAPLRLKNWVLLAFSLLFYAWGGVRYTLLILLSIVCNYLCGLALGHFAAPSARRAVLAVGVLFNLGMLGYFKYYDFFAGSLQAAGITALPVRNIVLPIGISFYTFQAMSYVIDLYRGQIAVQRSLPRFALYIALFPQLIAGPIVRYCDIENSLPAASRRVTSEDFCYGIKRFIIGLGKKVIFANQLGSYYATITSVQPRVLPWQVLALGSVLYAMQLYYDFSGYSDMAIGLGRMFGFRFPENFDYPYLSRSISEYWRRWHMTLGTWFREYVYIPLGGNRKGRVRTLVNLFLVFFLTGFWHGADWQFVVFGILMGLTVVIERLFLRKILDWLPAVFGHVYTIGALYVMLTIFGAPSLRRGLSALRGIFTLQAGAPQYLFSQFVDSRLWFFLALALALCGPVQALVPKLRALLYHENDLSVPGMVFLLVVLLYSIMRVTASSYNPFIYFRF